MTTTQAWSITLLIICTLQNHLITTKADKISSLPGQPNANFQQFSGYINVDEKKERFLFYYFVEAETEPDSKPLVLWLNGGVGCSSFGVGAFVEHGPFRPNGKVLVRNNYSWNKAANMLYLESLAGVGFSYSTNKSFYKYVDDKITTRDNLKFLEKWIEEFPEFKEREFYITGEGYSGHYAPQLASLIIQSKSKLSLKGVAIGNPLLELDTDLNSKAEFSWSHGLISDSTYNQMTFVCNYSQIARQSITNTMTRECKRIRELYLSEISDFVDTDDVTDDVCLSVMQQSRFLNKLQDEPKIDVCVWDETYVYLNRKDVQKALHARLVGVKKWTTCSDVVHYNWQNMEIPTISILGSLVKSNIRILIYSGDQDAIIPLTGTRTLVHSLAKQLGLNTTKPYRAWFEGRQVAGWTQSYGDYLSYATMRGASHEVSFSRPKRSLLMFSSFLEGKPLPVVKG